MSWKAITAHTLLFFIVIILPPIDHQIARKI